MLGPVFVFFRDFVVFGGLGNLQLQKNLVTLRKKLNKERLHDLNDFALL